MNLLILIVFIGIWTIGMITIFNVHDITLLCVIPAFAIVLLLHAEPNTKDLLLLLGILLTNMAILGIVQFMSNRPKDRTPTTNPFNG